MSAYLDLDDAAAPHPKAVMELAELRTDLAICRDAIEQCFDIVQHFDCYSHLDDGMQRTTLRRLNEAVSKATPRLLYERPEGQKLYGLRWRELADQLAAEKARADVAEAERDTLRLELARANVRLEATESACQAEEGTVAELRAELAALRAQEPVGQAGDVLFVGFIRSAAVNPDVSPGAKLYANPPPAQPAADAQALRDAAVLARDALALALAASSTYPSVRAALHALDAALGTDRSEAPK